MWTRSVSQGIEVCSLLYLHLSSTFVLWQFPSFQSASQSCALEIRQQTIYKNLSQPAALQTDIIDTSPSSLCMKLSRQWDPLLIFVFNLGGQIICGNTVPFKSHSIHCWLSFSSTKKPKKSLKIGMCNDLSLAKSWKSHSCSTLKIAYEDLVSSCLAK